jgi:hypothetical protein
MFLPLLWVGKEYIIYFAFQFTLGYDSHASSLSDFIEGSISLLTNLQFHGRSGRAITVDELKFRFG